MENRITLPHRTLRAGLLIILLALLSCEQSAVMADPAAQPIESAASLGPAGTWDVRWESVSFIHQRPTDVLGYLVIQSNQDGWTATLRDQPVSVTIEDRHISFTYTEALRSETSGRIGQVTLTFSGDIDGDAMRGTLSRIDGIINRRMAPFGGAMLIPDADAAPGYSPVALAQMDFVPIRLAEVSDDWSATRVIARHERPRLDGVWVNRPEMADDWLADAPYIMTPDALQRRSEWVPFDDPALRCGSTGLVTIWGWPMPVDIMQDERQVAFMFEGEGAIMRVHTDGRDMPEDWVPSGMGYTIGRYNEDVLEATTRWLLPNIIGPRGLDQQGDETIVKTRYRVTQDGKFLLGEMVLEDPLTYTEPLRRKFAWERNDQTDIVPYECDAYTFFRGLYEDGNNERYFSAFPKY